MIHKTSRNDGFTLIELMVAMTVGLLISGVAVAIFITSKNTSRMGNALARYQEGFRYASYVMSRDIRMAGFFGCNEGATPTVLAKGMDADIAYDTPIRGYDNSAPSSITGRTAGTDVLKIQSASTASLRPSVAMSAPAEPVKLTGSGTSFANNDYAVIADCSTSTIFQITSVSGTDPVVIEHTTGGNTSGSFSKAFDLAAEVSAYVTSYYYAATASDGRKVLMRRTLRGSTVQNEEIAEGIEDLQFLYGIDTDGNTTANQYVEAGSVSDWNRVLSVRVCMLTRSLDDNLTTSNQKYYDCKGVEQTATDRRLHASSFFTVALRNRTG